MAARKRSRSEAEADAQLEIRVLRELNKLAKTHGLTIDQVPLHSLDKTMLHQLDHLRDRRLDRLTRRTRLELRLQVLVLWLRQVPRGGDVARRANQVLDAWSTILPARIASEDLADYLEDIHRRAAAGQRFKVALRTAAAMFWTLVNAIGYTLERLYHKKGA